MRFAALDKLAVLLAALALALAGGAVAWRLAALERQPATVAEPTFSSDPYQPSGVDAPVARSATWTAPASRGAWSYDVFTPPEIFYNPRTREFTVTPPGADAETVAEGGAAPFGLEVVAVKQEPYRLQLVGFVGGPGDYAGAFQNVATSEHFLSRGKLRLPDLGLSIERVAVVRRRFDSADLLAPAELVAVAEVRDERAGDALVVLNSRERHLTGAVTAVVVVDGATHSVHQGDVLKSGAATYRIEKISLAPALVEVVHESAELAEPERKSLAPRAAESPANF